MFRRPLIAIFGCLAVLGVAEANGPPYHIGHVASPQDIRNAGISISPDGTGLPPGRGNANEGRGVYQANCAMCHGTKGEGNEVYPALVGGRGTLKGNAPILTVGSYWPYATTVWDYINRAMPYTNPGSLKSSEVYAVTAYVLYLNGIIAANDELNLTSLPKVRMPNRNGFSNDPRPDVP